MKQFLFKSALFFVIVISIVTFLLLSSGGYIDYFYVKFTSPKAKSMILGDSRSFQGIQPKVINTYFKNNVYDLPILNYSFTIAQISYDSLYLESVKRKLDTTARDGLFILSVHPWVLSNRQEKNSKQNLSVPPYNMNNVSCNPNYEYLLKNYNYFHFKSIVRKTSFVHKDGWLEESNLPKDSLTLEQWKIHQIKMYSGFAKKWKKSNQMLFNLEKMIDYLYKYGTVVLVRMPIGKRLKSIENNYWPNFEKEIQKIAVKKKINYISYLKDSNRYKTYDGNHIDKYGGVFFTKNLCKRIKSNR